MADPQLSDEQIAEFKEAFSLLDEDSDGLIPTYLLGKLLRSLGKLPTQAELTRLTKDKKTIDFPEFLALVSRQSVPQRLETDVRDALLTFNKDGGLDRNELKRILMSVGEPLTDEEVNEFLKDVSGNSVEDLVKALVSTS
ncbi:hypothetical protein SpCBS45565_g05360 [Spizellomyces sp. 'palustris']|nr:hypothetical protein SpCBS45565_g05360 [Spizellomyces sp. 'palustris']